MGRSTDDSIRRDAQSREITGTEVPSLKNKILMAIPETEYRVVQSHLEPFKFRQHCILHEPTRNLEVAYFLNHGLISLLVATEDGKTVEAGMVGNEGVIGVAAALALPYLPCAMSCRLQVTVSEYGLAHSNAAWPRLRICKWF